MAIIRKSATVCIKDAQGEWHEVGTTANDVCVNMAHDNQNTTPKLEAFRNSIKDLAVTYSIKFEQHKTFAEIFESVDTRQAHMLRQHRYRWN